MTTDNNDQIGISGRIARAFLTSSLTPLLALTGLLLGLFAVGVTPKEEEPQIDVTMASVLVPFPGASAKEVESLVATPAEQVLSEIDGVEHVYSTSTPGLALVTVQFKVGVPRQEALVKLYNQVWSNADWLPANLGTGTPLVKPKGIDDVPVMSLTLASRDGSKTAHELADVAHTLETELKRVPGTRDIYTLGVPDDIVRVTLDPARLAAYDIDFNALRASLIAANRAMSPTQVVQDGRQVEIRAGDFFRTTDDVAALIVGTRGGEPVFLSDVAEVTRQPDTLARSVRHWSRGAAGDIAPSHSGAGYSAAVTLAIAKQPGENAIDITESIQARLAALHNVVIPPDIEVTVTRNYGQTAADKSAKLIQKLLFATSAVIALVFFALGRREAFIVGSAVIITLAVTLFASWAWGFTLNRVSLFALIFSIGILVDDAIVVVENIHRHMALPENADKTLLQLIPRAVDEVGAPTILATFTVIAALMPMAFVSGLMGPYMSPIPINASTGMLISLAVAFVVTPWMAAKFLRHGGSGHEPSRLDHFFSGLAQKLLAPLVDPAGGKAKRHRMYGSVMAAIGVAVMLPVLGLVVLKMLPFDNKSEFQVIVDMPEGTPVEDTQRVLVALANHLQTVPEVDNLQLYAGTAAPINFNGLVRQYYLRGDAHMGDIQVNLADKQHRDRSSHAIALSVREPLQKIGLPLGANVKIVEVPPGPPVQAPIVAEVYGYDDAQRIATARQVRETLASTPDVVDIDDSLAAAAPRLHYVIDRQKAARLGIEYAHIVQAVASLTGGEDISHLHDGQAKFAVPIRLALDDADKADEDALLTLKLATAGGRSIALADVVSAVHTTIEQPIHHKDLLPVVYVTADVAGNSDSPLYGMFKAAGTLDDAGGVAQKYIEQPGLAVAPSLKWDGEWQITYETFRDMGLAYGVGMILIYLLIVAQFGSYTVPLVIMAPIPLTVIGVMPGHALFGAQFTATSMIGMIALAGIIVRNSILLVDFTNEQLRAGVALADAVVNASAVRAKPIMLTAFAAIIGAFFIIDDPIFNGLAIALIFGIFVSSLLTLVVIPVLYYVAMRGRYGAAGALGS